MSHPLVRARWLAPALFLALAAAALASGDHRGMEARLTARQAAMDPPRLWFAESLDASGARSGGIWICTDHTLRDGFTRANVEVDGRPCISPRAGVEAPGLFANRCVLDGRRFGVTVNRQGDPERDFTVAFAFTALDGSGDKARQVRRFREMGPCPAGWAPGDQAKPGQPLEFNATNGSWGA